MPFPFLFPIAASLAGAFAADAMAYRKADDGDGGGGTAGPPRRKPTREEERAVLIEQVEEEVIPLIEADAAGLVDALEAGLLGNAKGSLDDLHGDFNAGIELLEEAGSERLRNFERVEDGFRDLVKAVETHISRGRAHANLALFEARQLQAFLDAKLIGPWRMANDIVDGIARREEARPAGKRPPREPVEGVWTPKAETLCFACHGPEFPRGRASDDAMAEYMTPRPEGSYRPTGVTSCDKCGRAIVFERASGRHDIGMLGQVRDRLKDGLGLVGAELVQSGGMAGHLELPWEEDDEGHEVVLRVNVDDDGETLQVSHVAIDRGEDSEDITDLGSTKSPLRAATLLVTGLGVGTSKPDDVVRALVRALISDSVSDAIAGLLALFRRLDDLIEHDEAILDGPKPKFSVPSATYPVIVHELVGWIEAQDGPGSSAVSVPAAGVDWPNAWFGSLLAATVRLLDLWEMVDDVDRLAGEMGRDPIAVDPEKGYPRSFLPLAEQLDAFVDWADRWKVWDPDTMSMCAICRRVVPTEETYSPGDEAICERCHHGTGPEPEPDPEIERGTVNDRVAAGLREKGIEGVDVISSGGGFEHVQFLVRDVAGATLATVTLSDLSIDHLSAMVNVGSGGKDAWRDEEPSYSLTPKGPEYDVTPDEGKIDPARVAFAVGWVDSIDAAIRSALVAGEALDPPGSVSDVADVERTS